MYLRCQVEYIMIAMIINLGDRVVASKRSSRIQATPIDRPKSLAVLVAERLKEAIFRTELSLGEVLSEEKIAVAMNVSRTPVREALTLLQLQGLINIIPQSGSVVFKPDVEDMEALVHYRLMLESQAASMALRHDPAGAISRLREAIGMMEKAREAGDALAYAEADNAFHNAFFEYCGNHYVREAYDICSGRVAALRAHLAERLQMHRNRTYTEHLQIVEAFERGDEQEVVAVLSRHIGNMEGNYIQVLQDLDTQPER